MVAVTAARVAAHALPAILLQSKLLIWLLSLQYGRGFLREWEQHTEPFCSPPDGAANGTRVQCLQRCVQLRVARHHVETTDEDRHQHHICILLSLLSLLLLLLLLRAAVVATLR